MIPGVVCAGGIVVDVLTRPVEDVRWDATVWVDEIQQRLGGNGANTSCAVSRLGVRSRLLSGVGSDGFGDFALSALRECGVDVSRVERMSGETAVSNVLVRRDGARAVLYRAGVNRKLFSRAPDWGHELTAGFRYFHFANVFNLVAARREAPEMLRRAREAGLVTSLDAGHDGMGEWAAVLDPCLPFVDWLFVNRSEAEALSRLVEVHGAATELSRRGAGHVVVKLGGDGCAVYGRDGLKCRSAGFAVEAVDTTGAGDCFAGGFLAALARGLDIQEAARVANAVGALNVQRVGATAGLLDWEATVAWLKER